ncbi:hypothetical protein D3C80_1917660 [compost metagenome]
MQDGGDGGDAGRVILRHTVQQDQYRGILSRAKQVDADSAQLGHCAFEVVAHRVSLLDVSVHEETAGQYTEGEKENARLYRKRRAFFNNQ